MIKGTFFGWLMVFPWLSFSLAGAAESVRPIWVSRTTAFPLVLIRPTAFPARATTRSAGSIPRNFFASHFVGIFLRYLMITYLLIACYGAENLENSGRDRSVPPPGENTGAALFRPPSERAAVYRSLCDLPQFLPDEAGSGRSRLDPSAAKRRGCRPGLAPERPAGTGAGPPFSRAVCYLAF